MAAETWKNIVICADGTGNTVLKGRGTNVFKVYEAVDQNGHRRDPNLIPQVAIYHDGVGTESFKWLRILTGIFGIGLARTVREMYESLARVYAPGDQIYLFGFSRGAFAARTLAGLIIRCGVPRPQPQNGGKAELAHTVRAAYRQYRRGFRSLLERALFGVQSDEQIEAELEAFRKEHSWCADPTPVRFVGVWDTVDAVGSPFRIGEIVNLVFYQFKFTDRNMSRFVKRGCHALALDEERESFSPVLWLQQTPQDQDPRRIEQVWFSGVHSNVGGGYAKHGMSLVALDWMMHRAEQEGLRFVDSDRAFYRDHHSVNDELADSRAYLGVFYRWRPRNVTEICALSGCPALIHASVFERVGRGTDGYTPGNIPAQCQAVATQHAVSTIGQIGGFVAKAHAGKPSLLDQSPAQVWVGRRSYDLFVLGVAVLAGGTLIHYLTGAPYSDFFGFLSAVASMISPVTGWSALKAFVLAYPRTVGGGVCLLVLAYLLSWGVGRSMEGTFSKFWGRQQQALRQLLGL